MWQGKAAFCKKVCRCFLSPSRVEILCLARASSWAEVWAVPGAALLKPDQPVLPKWKIVIVGASQGKRKHWQNFGTSQSLLSTSLLFDIISGVWLATAPSMLTAAHVQIPSSYFPTKPPETWVCLQWNQIWYDRNLECIKSTGQNQPQNSMQQ